MHKHPFSDNINGNAAEFGTQLIEKRGKHYLIKLTAKKVYCPKCQKLVRVKLQKSGEKDQYCCIKCDYVIWDKAALKWKYYRYE